MEFELGESRLLYKSTVERFVGTFDSALRKAQRGEPAGFSRQRWKAMAELGLLHLPIEEEHGGIGGDAADCAVVAQALGYGISPEPWLECGFWPALLLQERADLAEIASGKRICAVAFSEPYLDGEWLPRTTVAERTGDHFRLTGEKVLVLGGADAELFIVTADYRGEATCFLVPRDTPGLSVSPYRIIDGGNAAALRLDGVKIAQSERFCSAEALRQSIAGAMLMASAEMVGLTQRLFEETLSYVKTREQFGQPIGRFQAIQHRMVDNYVALEKARSTLLWAIEGGWQAGAEKVAGAKAFIAQLARSVAHDSIQLHGGMGITDELLVGHALKRIVLLSRLFVDPVHGIRLFEGANRNGRA